MSLASRAPLAVLAAVAAVMIAARIVDGQHASHDHDSDRGATAFRDLVRESTTRFADKNAAVRAGYRVVGGDFPAMGRHWVHPGIILRGEVDPRSPAILSYAEIGGAPVLVGVAFAVALAPGEKPPLVAGKRRAWHEHNGSVAEESIVREHRHSISGALTRLAILHVWSGIDNPDGVFATDNWALPFARAGLAAPVPVAQGAARAISLLNGGADYYSMLIGSERPTDGEVARLLESARGQVRSIIGAGEPATALSPSQLGALDGVWVELVNALEHVVGEAALPLRVARARDEER